MLRLTCDVLEIRRTKTKGNPRLLNRHGFPVGAECGIRTHGLSLIYGFRDRSLKPLRQLCIQYEQVY